MKEIALTMIHGDVVHLVSALVCWGWAVVASVFAGLGIAALVSIWSGTFDGVTRRWGEWGE